MLRALGVFQLKLSWWGQRRPPLAAACLGGPQLQKVSRSCWLCWGMHACDNGCTRLGGKQGSDNTYTPSQSFPLFFSNLPVRGAREEKWSNNLGNLHFKEGSSTLQQAQMPLLKLKHTQRNALVIPFNLYHQLGVTNALLLHGCLRLCIFALLLVCACSCREICIFCCLYLKKKIQTEDKDKVGRNKWKPSRSMLGEQANPSGFPLGSVKIDLPLSCLMAH